jgi:sulfur carrier protein ThiS
MPIQIFLNATLRRFFPDYNPYQGISLDVAPGTTIAEVISLLSLPPEETTLLMVNGRRQEADFALEGTERLGLFPPIGGG